MNPERETNLLGRIIDAMLMRYAALIAAGHKPGEPELDELAYLRHRIDQVFAVIGGRKPEPHDHTPRWPVEDLPHKE